MQLILPYILGIKLAFGLFVIVITIIIAIAIVIIAIVSVEYHVYRTTSVWGLASDLHAYKDP
jgi:hypothetical protein